MCGRERGRGRRGSMTGARGEHVGVTWGGHVRGVRGAARCESPASTMEWAHVLLRVKVRVRVRVRVRVSPPSKMEWIHVLALYGGAGVPGSSLADASLPARPAPWPVAFFSRFSSSSAHSFSR